MARGWVALVVAAALALSIGLGVIVGLSVRYLHGLYTSSDVRLKMSTMYVAAFLLVFLAAGVWKGVGFATRHVLPVTIALAIAAGLIAVVTGSGTGVGGLLALLFVVVTSVIVTLAVVVRAVAGIAGRIVFSLVAIAGGLAGGLTSGGVPAALVAICAVLMARRGGTPLLERTTVAVASRHGTSFRNANLAGANLVGARLVACDFRGANLQGAHLDRRATKLCRFDDDVSVGRFDRKSLDP